VPRRRARGARRRRRRARQRHHRPAAERPRAGRRPACGRNRASGCRRGAPCRLPSAAYYTLQLRGHCSMKAQIRAWLVHAYTALGLVCAAAIAVLIVRGGDAAFRTAFLLMLVATGVDATDGWLARRADVKAVLPWFDGAM